MEPNIDTPVQSPVRPRPITVPQALARLNENGKVISKEKLYRALKAKELPSFRVGRKVLVDLDELLAAMRAE